MTTRVRALDAFTKNTPPRPYPANCSRLADGIAMLCTLANQSDDFVVQALLLKQAGPLVEELRERLLRYADWPPPLDPPFGPEPVARTDEVR